MLGFYVTAPKFKTRSDGSTAPGSVMNEAFVAFNDRLGLLKNGAGVDLTISADLVNYLSGAGVGSRGFESLAFDEKQRLLYAVPEAASTDDALRPVPGDERVLEIFEFNPKRHQYTGRTFKYQKDGPATANNIVIGDMTNIKDDVYVLIERDSFLGVNAVVKRLYLIDLDVVGPDGILEKTLLIDLLNIDDPRDIGGNLPGLDANKFNNALRFHRVRAQARSPHSRGRNRQQLSG